MDTVTLLRALSCFSSLAFQVHLVQVFIFQCSIIFVLLFYWCAFVLVSHSGGSDYRTSPAPLVLWPPRSQSPQALAVIYLFLLVWLSSGLRGHWTVHLTVTLGQTSSGCYASVFYSIAALNPSIFQPLIWSWVMEGGVWLEPFPGRGAAWTGCTSITGHIQSYTN